MLEPNPSSSLPIRDVIAEIIRTAPPLTSQSADVIAALLGGAR